MCGAAGPRWKWNQVLRAFPVFANLFLRQSYGVESRVCLDCLLEALTVQRQEPSGDCGARHLVDESIKNVVQFLSYAGRVRESGQFEVAESGSGTAEQEI